MRFFRFFTFYLIDFRGLLLNIGFAEAMKIHPFDCFIFHDVDLIPENIRNIYKCSKKVIHMSSSVSSFEYKLPYETILGGVGAFPSQHFEKVNGMSNCFFGWGGEDDDLYNRVRHYDIPLERRPLVIGRYTMLGHVQQTKSKERYRVLSAGFLRYLKDGLSSLNYTLLHTIKNKLYTNIVIDFDKHMFNCN